MSDQKTYVKHVKTGEVFEVHLEFVDVSHTYDNNGERRIFKREMLTPYEPEEAWEDVPDTAIMQHHGFLEVHVPHRHDGWFPVPNPYTRTITRDGKLVVQRRKG